jgi:hypothetical protein
MENNKKEGGNSDDNRKDMVEITIGDKTYEIHRGNQKVSEIKELGKINPNHILVQIIDGKLVDLPNDGSVTIKGGEVFKSHPPVGDNS